MTKAMVSSARISVSGSAFTATISAALPGTIVPTSLSSPTWVAAQTVWLMTIYLNYWNAPDAWSYGTGYLCFQLFAMTTAQTAVREVRARRQLAVVVDELRATRALLAVHVPAHPHHRRSAVPFSGTGSGRRPGPRGPGRVPDARWCPLSHPVRTATRPRRAAR